MRKIIATLASIAILAGSFPSMVFASGPAATLRQEINITDGYFAAASGATATSSAIIQLDTTQYSGTVSYYFEVEASSTAASDSVYLSRATGGTHDATVTVNTSTYGLFRSAAFTPPAGQTNYVVSIDSATGVTGVKSARIVVVQSIAGTTNSDATSTETQIEIGNQETYTANATSTFASPKYWYYNSSAWDSSLTFYAEVTYANTVEPTVTLNAASSTTYSTAGTFNVAVTASSTNVKVQLWGGGGAGGGRTAAARPDGGAGGAGGQYAESTLTGLAGLTKTLIVGASTAGSSGALGATGKDSTWDATVVVAKGGAGGAVGTGGVVASSTGSTTGCVGSTNCFAGGSSGGGTAAQGGAGGGGAGTTGAGGSVPNAGTAGAGTTIGGGNGGAKVTSTLTPGNAGSNFGGGGSGAFGSTNAAGTGGTGAQGEAIITDTQQGTAVGSATTTISLQEDNGSFGGWADKASVVSVGTAGSATRIRSTAFTPTNGKHYRIVFSNGYNGATFAIYNAKIIVDTASPSPTMDVLVVAGGAGGGGADGSTSRGGGGGAGGYRENTTLGVSVQTYTITVGGGGAGGVSNGTAAGGTGSNSSFGSALVSDGGGGGGTTISGVSNVVANNGGSGGGAPGDNCHSTGTAYGLTIDATEGNNGGLGEGTCSQQSGSGGGGAGSVGSPDTTNGGTANGGTGKSTSISGSSNTYAVGGNAGGGTSPGTAGAANTGNGGNGKSGTGVGGAGGSGIVVVSWVTASYTVTCNGSQTANGSNTVCTYNSSSTFVVSAVPAPVPFTKIEGQYLFNNTSFASGTGLQTALNKYDPVEWSGTANTYYLDVDAANASASVVVSVDSTGATTYGTVSSPNNEATSSLTCIPSAATTADTKATTNNGDVYGARWLVAVVIGGAGGTTACAAAAVTTPIILQKGGQLILRGTQTTFK